MRYSLLVLMILCCKQADAGEVEVVAEASPVVVQGCAPAVTVPMVVAEVGCCQPVSHCSTREVHRCRRVFFDGRINQAVHEILAPLSCREVHRFRQRCH